jgi:hypothetical protein
MSKSKSIQLVNKSIDCMVSAIEMYNKPDFRYREEVFCIMAINAWELLLKAKLLKDNNNNLSSIYVREYINKKDGSKSKRWKYRESRSGNNFTVEIFGALKKLKSKKIIDEACFANIEALVEIRDNAVHFYNKDSYLNHKIQELGTATIVSYLIYMQEWFSLSLEKYNFYLMPLSFFHAERMDAVILGERDKATDNLLKYLAGKEKRYPSNPDTKHNITIAIETTLVKSNTADSRKFSPTSDKDAPKMMISIEDIQKSHPLDYAKLTNKMRSLYKDFKVNKKYHELRQILEKDQKYCFHYPLNPQNPDGATKPLFSPTVFEEFDKNYVRFIEKVAK